MRDELSGIAEAVEKRDLPHRLGQLFGSAFSEIEGRFLLQETYVLDFKETIPERFSDGYGAGIVRLTCGLHNSYGGVIVFGVRDSDFKIAGISSTFDIEAFNRVLSDFTGARFECVMREYSTFVDSAEQKIVVLLVPRRGSSAPIRLLKQLQNYKPGTLWVRDRHEVVEARSVHLPALFSGRDEFSNFDLDPHTTIHKSLPPSPATMKDFIGRFSLSLDLWSWLVFGTQPRMYLHGPGGSGKSTLAYEFARAVAEQGRSIRYSDGSSIDYVIYLSGKETEFNSVTGKEQAFALRSFSNTREQFAQILYHAGLQQEEELNDLSEDQSQTLLDELFQNFSGLIVIDDIDALSRRHVDTGEESLFLKAAIANKRTRILYTLRFTPPHALKSSLGVPGLGTEEFIDFVNLCCNQFGVSVPPGEALARLQEATEALPLLIETVIGLRKNCSNFTEAFRVFQERGGDGARKYLYQREYDQLTKVGKARQLLAALAILEAPVPFDTIVSVLSCGEEQIREAISESSSIFLTIGNSQDDNTKYQLASPAVGFIQTISNGLPEIATIRRSIEHFRSSDAESTPLEAVIIQKMYRAAQRADFLEIVKIADEIAQDNPVKVNPRFKALLGQGYAGSKPANSVQARECFRSAWGLNYSDIFMMRSWYYVEKNSGYSLDNAIDVCNRVIDDKKYGQRSKAEFYSKLGSCLAEKATPHVVTDPSRAISLYKDSLRAYFNAGWFGKNAVELNPDKHKRWVDKILYDFFRALRDNIAPYFDFLEELPKEGHDADIETIKILVDPLRVTTKLTDRNLLEKVRGLSSRSIKQLRSTVKQIDEKPGFKYLLSVLDDVVGEINERLKQV